MDTRPLIVFAWALSAIVWSVSTLRAQIGEDNATGVAGQFNGNVTTAGSYDPYTGNATRSVTDIVVPGAVGAYPLAFIRTLNTRTNLATASGPTEYPFGKAGGWRHNYQWEVKKYEQTFGTCDAGQAPPDYTVTYPDGRQVKFIYSATDDYYRAEKPGIRERFSPVTEFPDDQSHGDCFLLLPDGGAVHFIATIVQPNCSTGNRTVSYTFTCSSIIDPFRVTTEITQTGGITQITEAGQRNLRIKYLTRLGQPVIESVEERPTLGVSVTPTRKVNYFYTTEGGVNALEHVEYSGLVYSSQPSYYTDQSESAYYTYQARNVGPITNPPLIKTCDDPRFVGAMSRIRYLFTTSQGSAYGQLASENYYDGVNPNGGGAVSILNIVSPTIRREESGDGRTRDFTYSGGYLSTWTDFKTGSERATMSQEHITSTSDSAGPVGFVKSVKDGRLNQTDFTRSPITGHITSTTYPLTPSDASGQRAATSKEFNPGSEPYYVTSVTNENQDTTIFARDPITYRVTDINSPANSNYPNGVHEGFHYNGFGQVDRHQRKNGFYEHVHYDTRGLPTVFFNPTSDPNPPDPFFGNVVGTRIKYHGFSSDNPAQHPEFDVWLDRVASIVDQRGYETNFEYDRRADTGAPYNGRGLISKIIYPLTPPDTERRYVTYGYDSRGRKIWQENELRQRTTFTYDEFNRLRKVETPLPNGGIATTKYSYNPEGMDENDVAAYKTTANTVRVTKTPTGRITVNDYDENLRLKWTTAKDTNGSSGPNDPDKSATTQAGYDLSGNLNSIIDPEGHQTVIEFDQRNRRSKVTSAEVTLPPPTPGGTPTTTQYITEWFYDPASNLRRVNLPDGEYVEMKHDSMNRVWQSWDQLRRLTTNTYYPSGMLKDVTDPKAHIVGFEYDSRDLKTKMKYPSGEVKAWRYDAVGNLEKRELPRPGNSFTHFGQTFTYDERNRLKTMRWDDSGDWADFGYDPVGRLTKANNPYSYITRDYDEGGRLLFDRQDLLAPTADPQYHANPPNEEEAAIIPHKGDGDVVNSNSLVADVNYEHDADGRVKRLWISYTTYDYQFGYDELGRFETISQSGVTPGLEFQYKYNRNSFVMQRNSFINGTAQVYLPDELSRMISRKILLPNTGTPFSDESYRYDRMSRATSVYRTEDGRAETFEYNDAGELTKFRYGLQPDGNGGFVYPPPSQGGIPGAMYSLDEAGNRTQVIAGDLATIWTTDEFNQYTQARYGQVSNNPLLHQVTNYDGVDYSYLYDGQLRTATSAEGSYAFGYDALGRRVRQALNGSSIIYAYDGVRAIAEFDTSDSFSASTLYGLGIDEVLARGIGEQMQYYLHQDRLGSVTAVTNFQGQVVETYRYDDFGTPAIKDGSGMDLPESSINNRFMFTGREYNKLGFYEYRARAYHPGLGRFMSEDPLGFAAGDMNLFRYCGGDPVNWVDPTGLWQVTLWAARGVGGYLSFGYNSGQWNVQGAPGVGYGGSFSVNLNDQGIHRPESYIGIIGTASAGNGVTEGEVSTYIGTSAYIGDPEKSVSFSGAVGGIGKGIKIDKTGGQLTGASFNIGTGTFLGVLGSFYSWAGPIYREPGGFGFPSPGSGHTEGFDAHGNKIADFGLQPNIIATPLSPPSLGSFGVDFGTFNSPGFGSGLNSGSTGGASAGAVLPAIFQTLTGVPGGGGATGEGFHPVPPTKF